MIVKQKRKKGSEHHYCWHVGRKEGDQYAACVKLTPDKRDRSMGPTATTADQERGTWFELSEDGEWQENPSIEVVSWSRFPC